jgi:hypothetical protein
MARKGFAGAARPTTITTTMTPADPDVGGTFDIASSTGWAFTVMPFVVTVDRGEPEEEKILCSAVSGNTLTVGERGYDGTTAADHASGASILHVLDSVTVDEANAHVNQAHSHEHIQITPDTTWTVTHNLGYHPTVSVIDSAGSWVVGDVDMIDINSLTITFAAVFSGKAYCS